ncbi:hypothetical protein SLEP1_g45526 [Rubroshorea leprosula]|uniref:Uncharacterized protein n=1 Tax=Rubroshorea leprosula TaxID=152421 RepID=A0AAV5LK40_9ROSI|nr:hypothetical protein SLEP1_g45526 [Rubroshorea leprosula]
MIRKLDLPLQSCDFKVPTEACLPNLKVFQLKGFVFSNDESSERLFSSCPALEDLAWQSCYLRVGCHKFSVSNPSLKRLTITAIVTNFLLEQKILACHRVPLAPLGKLTELKIVGGEFNTIGLCHFLMHCYQFETLIFQKISDEWDPRTWALAAHLLASFWNHVKEIKILSFGGEEAVKEVESSTELTSKESRPCKESGPQPTKETTSKRKRESISGN